MSSLQEGLGRMGSAAAVFNLIVCFGVPLGAFISYLVRNRQRAAFFGLGVLSFLVSQVLLRLPLLSVLQQQAWFTVFSLTQPLVYTAALALSASLFEEFARLAFMTPLRRRPYHAGNAVAFGLGHGGLEAMLVGVNNAVLLAVAPEQLAALGPAVAWAGVERLAALAFHVACSLLIYRALTCRKPGWFVLALALHFVCDFCTAFAGSMPTWVYELAFCAVSTVLLAVLAYAFRCAPEGAPSAETAGAADGAAAQPGRDEGDTR